MAKEIIYSDAAPKPIGPYSQAVKANGILFVSGQIALDPETGELVNENITEETHAVMKNLDAILQASGYSFSDVVKCSIFVRDMNEFGTINEAYGRYFKSDPPARETAEVSKLPKDVQVEISCIALKG